MLAALIIVFREVFEAGLIVGIVLAVTGSVAHRFRWIGGALAGVVAASLVAAFAGALPQLFEEVSITTTTTRMAALNSSWPMPGTMSGWRATAGRLPIMLQDAKIVRGLVLVIIARVVNASGPLQPLIEIVERTLDLLKSLEVSRVALLDDAIEFALQALYLVENVRPVLMHTHGAAPLAPLAGRRCYLLSGHDGWDITAVS